MSIKANDRLTTADLYKIKGLIEMQLNNYTMAESYFLSSCRINKELDNQLNLAHPRVLTSPHLGASTEESEENCACLAVSELKEYLDYGTISRSVNFPTVESIPSGSCHARLIMINRDIPGMIGFASNIIGSRGINIASYLNESNGLVGYNIIDVESPIPDEVIAEIEAHPDVIRTRIMACHN